MLLLIVVFSALRLLYASTLQLGADESYYWTYALKPEWNYFDHPPMVAWLIRLTTINLLLHNEIFVRLGAIIGSAISTWLIFKIGNAIKSEQAGWYAAILYTASVYASTNAGAYIMPDGPLMVFWLSSIFILINILNIDHTLLKANRLWYLFGVTSGLAIMSKAHGIFLWIGLVLYVVINNRNWLRYRGIYLAAVLCFIITSPIIIWNIQHHFITYKFHSSRISFSEAGLNFNQFFKALLQQISINNPINVVLIASSTWYFIKTKLIKTNKYIQLVICCSLPLILLVLFISLFRETFPHWASPAFCSLLILPAMKLANDVKNTNKPMPNSLKTALVYLLVLSCFTIYIINYFPGTLSHEKQGIKTGLDDATLDFYGWENAGIKFDSLYKSDVAKKIMLPGTPVVVTNWFPASAIEYNITSITGQQVLGMGNINDLHQYYWTNKDKNQLKKGDNAYLIIPSHLFYFRNFNLIKQHFNSFNQPLTITQNRGGMLCQYIYVFRFKGYKP